MLHAFRFVNPVTVPPSDGRLVLLRPGELLALGITPKDLAIDVQNRIDGSLRAEEFLQARSIVSQTDSDVIAGLKRLVRSTGKFVEDATQEFASQASARETKVWGQSIVISKNRKTEQLVPYLCWGDFFEAVRLGSTAVKVPRPSKNSSDTVLHPEGDISLNGGMGLTINCAGDWGARWATAQIDAHLAQWTSNLLRPPAAILAYESLSRSMEFIEYSRVVA